MWLVELTTSFLDLVIDFIAFTIVYVILWLGPLIVIPILWASIKRVPKHKYGVVTAKWLPWSVDRVWRDDTVNGKKVKYYFNQGFVPKWYNGLWAYKLNTGLNFLFLWRVWGGIDIRDMSICPPDKRPMYIAMAGREIPDGEVMVVEDYDSVNGQTFLENAHRGYLAKLGSPGYMNVFGYVLKDGEDRPSDGKAYLFLIRLVDPIPIGSVSEKGLNLNNPEEEISVPQFGVVKANVGRQMQGEGYRDDEEIVAALPQPTPDGLHTTHSNFTDLFAFIKMGGGMGNQREVIETGEYFIHPVAFDVEIKKATVVPENYRAALVSRIGSSANEDGSDYIEEYFVDNEDDKDNKNSENRISVLRPDFDLRKRDDEYRRGILSYTYGPGTYPFNPYIVRVILVKTKPIHVEVEVKAISKELFDLNISLEFLYRIEAGNIPKVIAVSGSTEELEETTIMPRLEAIVFDAVSKIEIRELMNNRVQIIKDVSKEIEKVLKTRFAKLIRFRISGIDGSQDEGYKAYESLRAREVNAKLEKGVLIIEEETEKRRVLVKHQEALAANQRIIAEAELYKDAAENTKKGIKARGDSMKEFLEGGSDNGLSDLVKIVGLQPDALPKLIDAFSRLFCSKST